MTRHTLREFDAANRGSGLVQLLDVLDGAGGPELDKLQDRAAHDFKFFSKEFSKYLIMCKDKDERENLVKLFNGARPEQAVRDQPQLLEDVLPPQRRARVLVALVEEDANLEDDPHVLDHLDAALASDQDCGKYDRMLARAIGLALSSPGSPFSILEAYGLGDTSGVVPISLVHSNRMPQEVAAVLGTMYDYPAEPLAGTGRPCPPGPGLPVPWGGPIAVPWVFVHIPLWYYGQAQSKLYAQARANNTRSPPHHPRVVGMPRGR